MSHYSDDPRKCRVDFFKDTGNFYVTEAVTFQPKWHTEPNLRKVFLKALKRHLKKGEDSLRQTPRLGGMTAVCLEPDVSNPVPILIVVPETWEGFNL